MARIRHGHHGFPMVLTSEPPWHVDTSMVDMHYGHISQSAKADSIRKLSPKLKISKPKVKVLKIGKKEA